MTVLTRFDLLQYLGWRGFWDADRGSRGMIDHARAQSMRCPQLSASIGASHRAAAHPTAAVLGNILNTN